MKYYIIAGEASGDLHGSNLIKALYQHDPQTDCRVWGGDLMEQAGATLVKHYRDLAFMGFMEVVKNIRTISKNFSFCKKDILQFAPDVLILIDYPGFNLRMAKWAKQNNIRVFYYISPQLWAWHSSRVKEIKTNVDRLFVILPFEKAFYQKYDYEVDFVGHPLLDVVHQYPKKKKFRKEHGLSKNPIIALLPGSRKQEIRKMLATMLSVVPEVENAQFVIAGAPAIPRHYYEDLITASGLLPSRVHLVENKTYDLLNHAEIALVTSGTATLEAALFNVPQVVCYSGNPLSYQIAKRVINVDYISLVNLVLDEPIVTELIQHQFHTGNLLIEITKLANPYFRKEILHAYKRLKDILGNKGASDRTARLMVKYLRES